MTLEGDVANALLQLEECSGVTKVGMLRVLQHNPGSIHSFHQFREQLDLLFPNASQACGVVVPRSVLTNRAKDPSPLSFETQVKLTQTELFARTNIVKTLSQQREGARAAVQAIRPCSGFDCYHASEAVTKPHQLEASIRLHYLIQSRLDETIRKQSEVMTRLSDGSFDLWFVERTRAQRTAIADAALTTMRSALTDLERFHQRAPAVGPAVLELRHKLDRMEQSLKEGEIPHNILPAGPLDEMTARLR